MNKTGYSGLAEDLVKETFLKPKKENFCVDCSNGSAPCPPIQETGKSCCNYIV